MRPLVIIAVALFVSAPAFAQAAKPCEELKSEIAKKLEANNVKAYSLEIVDKAKDADGKVVGTCDGGTRKIVYCRTTTPAQAAATAAAKP
jgi:outer membrane lipoprotein-sorting protein